MGAKIVRNTLLKHQQRVVALGYVANQISAQLKVFTPDVSVNKKKEIKERKRDKGLVVLHDLTFLLY